MIKLEVKNLTKKINNNLILDNVSMELESGNIYGFVGKNGSGKTMLFRAIVGLIKPTHGEIYINNIPVSHQEPLPCTIGIVIENVGLYNEFTGYQNLKYLASIRKCIGDNQIIEVINRVGLDAKDKRTIKKYSLGMKQRITIAQAIMEKPDILLLDEPTNGLDKDGIELIREIIRQEKERGALILIASHNEEDIHLLCDKKYQVEQGKFEESVSSLGGIEE